MKSIMLKDIPPELHGQLQQAAEANFRSLTKEVMARIEQSFRFDEIFSTKQTNDWIQEAIASGPEEPLSRRKLDAAFKRGLKRGEAARRATR